MNNEQGFTLIELLVAMAIFILLTAGFVLKYSTTDDLARLHATETRIVETIKEARHDSVVVKEFGNGTGIFPSYGIMFDTSDPTKITLYADCVADDDGSTQVNFLDEFRYDPSSTDCNGTNGLIKEVSLERGIEISKIETIVGSSTTNMTDGYVEYLRPFPTVFISQDDGDVLPYGKLEITLTAKNSGNSRVITVWNSGLIETDSTQ